MFGHAFARKADLIGGVWVQAPGNNQENTRKAHSPKLNIISFRI